MGIVWLKENIVKNIICRIESYYYWWDFYGFKYNVI